MLAADGEVQEVGGSSSVSVPEVTTMPARSRSSRNSVLTAARELDPLIERDLAARHVEELLRLGPSVGGSSGTDLINSSAVRRPPGRFEIVPPVATSRTRGSAAPGVLRRRRLPGCGRCRGAAGVSPSRALEALSWAPGRCGLRVARRLEGGGARQHQDERTDVDGDARGLRAQNVGEIEGS